MDVQEPVKALAELITQANKTVVLTGAGISTESGIPDFRSPGAGFWAKMDPYRDFSADTLYRDPQRFYRIGFTAMVDSFAGAQPNAAHRVLAELEEAGLVVAVITQNIDGLHQQAGSRQVLEVHGHLRTARCTGCGTELEMEAVLEKVRRKEIPPRCEDCGKMLRPDVVLFGDPLPPCFHQAQSLVAESDLLVVIGSSLVVSPVNTLPTLASSLAIINLTPTPLDLQADVVIRAKASTALTVLREHLELRARPVRDGGRP